MILSALCLRRQLSVGPNAEVFFFAKVMTMGKKQILARPTGIQKEKCGPHFSGKTKQP